MEDRLQVLTEKIYQEGVQKGKAEAEEIIVSAKKEAEKIIAEAQKKSENLLANARKEAEALLKNTQSEVALSSRQALSALKQEMVSVIGSELVKSSVKPAFGDADFVKSIIKLAIEKGSTEENLLLYISESAKADTEKFLASNMKGVLDKKVTIQSVNGIKSGFQIGPADGSYKVSFTDDDFEAFFKELVRPGIVKYLFA
jgi:V/A-type H+/Na+-transporting ATPase subunit E